MESWSFLGSPGPSFFLCYFAINGIRLSSSGKVGSPPPLTLDQFRTQCMEKEKATLLGLEHVGIHHSFSFSLAPLLGKPGRMNLSFSFSLCFNLVIEWVLSWEAKYQYNKQGLMLAPFQGRLLFYFQKIAFPLSQGGGEYNNAWSTLPWSLWAINTKRGWNDIQNASMNSHEILKHKHSFISHKYCFLSPCRAHCFHTSKHLMMLSHGRMVIIIINVITHGIFPHPFNYPFHLDHLIQ